MARPTCFRLFVHFDRLAASRTFCTAGSNRPIRMAIIAMTTSNSISVNAVRRAWTGMRAPGEETDRLRLGHGRCGSHSNTPARRPALENVDIEPSAELAEV